MMAKFAQFMQSSYKSFENFVLFKLSTGYGPFTGFFAVFIDMDYAKES